MVFSSWVFLFYGVFEEGGALDTPTECVFAGVTEWIQQSNCSQSLAVPNSRAT